MNISVGFRKTCSEAGGRNTSPLEYRGSWESGTGALRQPWAPPSCSGRRIPTCYEDALFLPTVFQKARAYSKDETRPPFTYGKEDKISLKFIAVNVRGMAWPIRLHHEKARCQSAPASAPTSERHAPPAPVTSENPGVWEGGWPEEVLFETASRPSWHQLQKSYCALIFN